MNERMQENQNKRPGHRCGAVQGMYWEIIISVVNTSAIARPFTTGQQTKD